MAWTVDGLDAGTGATLAAGSFAAGQTVTCTVTPFDGTDAGAPVSASVSVGNAAPTLTSVTVTPDPATVTETLTCTASGFSDPDGDPDLTTFRWTVDGLDVGAGETLSGGFAKGDTVVCEATPFDGLSTGEPVSGSAAIVNTPPGAPDVSLTRRTRAPRTRWW